MSTFPTSLDNLPESHADGTGEVIHASTINNLASAVNAVESAAQPVVNGASANVTAANLNTLTGGGQTSLHSHAGGGPSSGIQYVDVQLNDTQIKALPSTSFEIVSADVSTLFLGAFVRLDGGGYTNISDGCTLQLSGPWNNSQPLANDVATGLADMSALLGLGNRVVYFPPEVKGTASTVAEGLQLIPSTTTGFIAFPLALYFNNAGGDLTGGDPANTLSIRVWYAVVPTAPFGA